MLWPCCAPPAQMIAFGQDIPRTMCLSKGLDVAAAGIVQVSVRNKRKGYASKLGTSRHVRLAKERLAFATIKRDKGGTAMAEQTFENHGRIVPVFHFFAVP